MSKCDGCEDCSCEDRNNVKLCETCGGCGQITKPAGPVKYLRLWNSPKETEQCPTCKGSGKEK